MIYRNDYQKLCAEKELKIFLDFLNTSNLDYCILYPYIPKRTLVQGDLDLYVNKYGYNKIKKYLLKNNWKQDKSLYFTKKRVFFSKFIHGYKLKLDIIFEYAFIINKTIYNYNYNTLKQRSADGYYYLNDFAGFCFITKKSMLKNNFSIEKNNDLNYLITKCNKLKNIYYSNLQKAQITTELFDCKYTRIFNLYGFITECVYKLRLSNSKLIVSFIGMDGAGKGTYIDLLKKSLHDRNIHFKHYYLGYSSFQSSLINKLVSKRKQLELNKFAIFIINILYLVLLPIEFLKRRGVGKYDVILTDRHPSYENIFPLNSIRRFYDKFISFICSNPNLVIYLTGDEYELWSRKKEMSIKQYQNKNNLLKELIKKNYKSNIITIDTTKNSIDYIYNHLQKIIDQNILLYLK